MTDNNIIKAFDILNKFEFFGGQRAGRELWFDKSEDVQDKDIEHFVDDVNFLKGFINRQKAEIEKLERKIESLESIQEISPEAKHFVDTKADKVISLMNEVIKSQKQIKAEAIKEFAERLKSEIETPVKINIAVNGVYKSIPNIIDDLVEEMKEVAKTCKQ